MRDKKSTTRCAMTSFSGRLQKLLLRIAVPVCAFACALPAYSGELVRLPIREQQTQAIFIERPSAVPPWVVVLFAGDNGLVALDDTGPTALKANFLLRTAEYWVSAGDALAIVDAPSDRSSGMNDEFRLSEAHAQDVHVIVA